MLKYLNEPQQRELLRAARGQMCPLAQRDFHWMAAMIITGMRVAEFSRLSKPVVQQGLAAGWLVSNKRFCKGKRKANEYYVSQQLRVHLLALLRLSDTEAVGRLLPEDEEQPLIWGRADHGEGTYLSPRSYQARMKIWVKAAGLDERLSPHALRHTRGMNIVTRTRGANGVKVAQIALNHASIKTTGIYLHASREDIAAQLQLVDARGRLSKRDAVRLAEGRA